MKTVITYGTFDLFHVGHIRLLKRLKDMGGKLIVGISSDEFNSIKGKQSFYSYEERAEIVLSCKYVDQVFPEDDWDQKRGDILKYNASIFAMGNDWQGKFDDLAKVCEVVYLPRTDYISTTSIKEKLAGINSKDLELIEKSMHDVIEIVQGLVRK